MHAFVVLDLKNISEITYFVLSGT